MSSLARLTWSGSIVRGPPWLWFLPLTGKSAGSVAGLGKGEGEAWGGMGGSRPGTEVGTEEETTQDLCQRSCKLGQVLLAQAQNSRG